MHSPQTLIEVIRYFSDPMVCIEYVARLRWPNGVACPQCGCLDLSWLTTRRIWKCKGCKKQFSVKVGTIFEDSPLGLDKWLAGVWLITNAKNGISSCEVARALGITQKSAWFMAHRIRLALQEGSFDKPLSGTVEADETYIGGLEKNKHESKKLHAGRGTVGKAVVMGLLERHEEQASQVRTMHIPNTKKETIQAEVWANVEEGSNLYTDTAAAYEGLDGDYVHETVNHLEEYVRGAVYTNGLENYWSLFKRAYHGTWTHLSDEHLHRYLDEQAFRFNAREEKDGGRFQQTVGRVKGRRITYAVLTRKNSQ